MTRKLQLFALTLSTLSISCTRLTPEVVHVDGRAVEVVEAGAGPVTVVFESGLGNDWSPWDEVASAVAVNARVFAYSRPGYGRSESSSEPPTAARIVEDLRAVLSARGLPPPYVLVGHSFGGAYMELFARLHPDEVVGVVLVDPRHRDFSASCAAAGISGCDLPASMVSTLPRPQPAEVEAYLRVSAEIAAAGPFGQYPVRVLTATRHGLSAEGEALWLSLLASLAHEASDGEQVVFEGAGHNLEVERPRDVTSLILGLIPVPAT